LGRVFFRDLPFHVFIQLGVNLAARDFFFAHTFQYSQESQNSLVGKLFLQVEAISNAPDKIPNIHGLRF
jgi:hypothetical protein